MVTKRALVNGTAQQAIPRVSRFAGACERRHRVGAGRVCVARVQVGRALVHIGARGARPGVAEVARAQKCTHKVDAGRVCVAVARSRRGHHGIWRVDARSNAPSIAAKLEAVQVPARASSVAERILRQVTHKELARGVGRVAPAVGIRVLDTAARAQGNGGALVYVRTRGAHARVTAVAGARERPLRVGTLGHVAASAVVGAKGTLVDINTHGAAAGPAQVARTRERAH